MKVLLFSFFAAILLLFPSKTSAQVIINELDSFSSDNDWIELYSYEDVDISGWILRDEASSIVATIPSGTFIGLSSNSFYTIDVGDRLNKGSDTVRLLHPDDITEESKLTYGHEGSVCAPEENQTVGRYPDANSTIERFAIGSKGLTNNNLTLNPCPTPTPVPSNTPTSTPKPTSSNTPTPTTKPTNTPTLRPSLTVTAAPTKEFIDSEKDKEDILGERAQITKDDDVEQNTNDTPNRHIPVAAMAFMLGGTAFLAAAVVPVIKNRKKALFDNANTGYNSDNDDG